MRMGFWVPMAMYTASLRSMSSSTVMMQPSREPMRALVWMVTPASSMAAISWASTSLGRRYSGMPQ